MRALRAACVWTSAAFSISESQCGTLEKLRARSVSHVLCRGESGNRSMSLYQQSTIPLHLSEAIGDFTEWKMLSEGANIPFCKNIIYLVLRCSVEGRQSSFFFFSNIFPFKVASKQTSKWQQKGKGSFFIASSLLNRAVLDWVTFCWKTFSKEAWSFHILVIAVQIEQGMSLWLLLMFFSAWK